MLLLRRCLFAVLIRQEFSRINSAGQAELELSASGRWGRYNFITCDHTFISTLQPHHRLFISKLSFL